MASGPTLLLVLLATWSLLPADARDAGRPASRERFPGAHCDPAETAALRQPSGRGPVVYRTAEPFGIVLNYYRFKAKQAVQVSTEDLGVRFASLAAQLERPDPPAALLAEPFVQRFAAHAGPGAWREFASRLAGRTQLVGEGQRVTLYRPYLSQRTFTLINETVIVLQQPGGTCENAAPDSEPGPVVDLRVDGRRRRARAKW